MAPVLEPTASSHHAHLVPAGYIYTKPGMCAGTQVRLLAPCPSRLHFFGNPSVPWDDMSFSKPIYIKLCKIGPALTLTYLETFAGAA